MFSAIQEQAAYQYKEKRQPLLLAIDEALRQRITVHYNFRGQTDKEAVDYIIHKLCMAGSSKAIIDEAALSAVAGHAHGNPRVIDTIMSDALIIGS